MRWLFFTFAILASYSLVAQDAPEEIKLWTNYPGYVITNDNDTIHGYLQLSNFVDNQKKALFYKDPDDDRYAKKYKAKDIKGYKVGPRCYESFKFCPATESKGMYFFLKVLDGPLSLYKWYYRPQDPTDESAMVDVDLVMGLDEDGLDSHLIGIKPNEEPVQLDSPKFISRFNKSMSKYLSDYPELAEKIANKEEGYQYGNLKEIVKEYNKWYE
jgi:hypothetical protein